MIINYFYYNFLFKKNQLKYENHSKIWKPTCKGILHDSLPNSSVDWLKNGMTNNREKPRQSLDTNQRIIYLKYSEINYYVNSICKKANNWINKKKKKLIK